MRIHGTKQYLTKSCLAAAVKPNGSNDTEYISTGRTPRKTPKGKNPRLVRKAGTPA